MTELPPIEASYFDPEAAQYIDLHSRPVPLTVTTKGAAPPPAPKSVALLVGPEGGLTDDEVARSIELGFNCMALGPRILRTETAPLAAISVLQARWGDFA